MVKQNALPFKFMRQYGSRIGLLPLDADSADGLRWYELPAFIIMHTVAAWEEEGGVVKVGS
jgi:carotenoid cleavage dioxygenase-like enzyme